MCYKPTMISPSCIFFSSFVSTCRFVCIVPSEVIAQLAVSRPKFLFKSHPGVPTCINKNWNWLAYSLWLWELVIKPGYLNILAENHTPQLQIPDCCIFTSQYALFCNIGVDALAAPVPHNRDPFFTTTASCPKLGIHQ